MSIVHFPLDHAMHIYLWFIYQFQSDNDRTFTLWERIVPSIESANVQSNIYLLLVPKLPKFSFIELLIKTHNCHKILNLMS